MKRIGQAIMVAGAALLGATGIAAAQGVGVDVGPGGVYLGVNPGYHHWHDWDHSYAYSPEHCRWIVHRHWSHFRHEWIVRRERVCD